MDQFRLISLFNSMLEADFAATKALVETHFDELRDPAVRGLLALLMNAERDPDRKDALRWHADLVEECQVLGIDEAFAAAKAAQTTALLGAVASEMTNAPSWSRLRATLATYGTQVLTDEFERTLRAMHSSLEAHMKFLDECRRCGTKATFRRHGVGGPHFDVDLTDVPPSVAQRLQELDAGGEASPSPSDRQAQALPSILADLDREAHPELWAALQDRLGNQHMLLARLAAPVENLEAAIRAYDRALETRTERATPNEWASTLNNKGIALQALLEHTGRFDLFHQVLDLFRSILRVWTFAAYPHDHAMALNNLGDALRALGDHEKAGSLYDEALGILGAAIVACDRTLFPADWAMITRNTGVVLMRLGDLRHDPENLRGAVAHLREAMAALEAAGCPPLFITTCNDLGNALRMSGERDGDVGVLRESAATLRRAAVGRSRRLRPQEWAATQADLASTLFKLGECEPGTISLGEAVIACRSALEEQAGAAELKPVLVTMNTLGAALCVLGQRESSGDLLQESIDVLRDVRKSASGGVSVAIWTSATINLASSLRSLGDVRQDVALYRESAAVARSALSGDLRERSAREWATIASNLGDAEFALGSLTSDLNLLQEAAVSYRLALEEREEDRSPIAWAVTQNNLGNALRICGELTRSKVELDASIQAYRSALVHLRRQTAPLEWTRVMKNLGSAYSSSGRFQEAVELLTGLLSGLVPAIWTSRSLEEQHAFLLAAAGVADELAYGMLRLGRIQEAIEAIEQGRAILLSQRLDFETDHQVRAALDAWRTASDKARLASGPAIMWNPHSGEGLGAVVTERERRNLAAAEAYGKLSALLRRRVARSPGTTDDLLSLAIPPGGAAIVFVVARAGGGAIVISSRDGRAEADLVELPRLTSRAVDHLVVGRYAVAGWLQSYADLQRDTTERGPAAALRSWSIAIGPFLDRLWDEVLAPVDSKLQHLGLAKGSELAIVPTGRLSILPLQAARRRDGSGHTYFVEDWAVSVTPTLAAAARSRAKARAVGDALPSLLAVTDPLGDLGASDNPAWHLFATHARERMDGAAATVEAVCSRIAGWSHLSFYCHGQWDPDDPENSGLVLAASEKLTIRTLRGIDLGSSRLAILGACETGVIGVHELPDEFVGLPGALVEAGVPGVISTLWPVEAGVTRRLVTRLLEAQLAGMTPAKALREAQIQFLGPASGPAPGRTVLQGAGAPGGGGSSGLVDADPVFWAAFVCAGA